jgi:phage/plasmid-associated DNA primase
VTECCEERTDAEASASSLYRSYVKWAEQTKEETESQRRFGEALAERGYERTRGNRGEVLWKGLCLRSEKI